MTTQPLPLFRHILLLRSNNPRRKRREPTRKRKLKFPILIKSSKIGKLMKKESRISIGKRKRLSKNPPLTYPYLKSGKA